MNVIEVKNVSVKYKNGPRSTLAVQNVSFNVAEGSYVCIVGDNGSGKSSLIKAIMGLHNISDGNIKLNVNREDISYLSQSTEIPNDFPATAKEIVLCGTQNGKRFFPFYRKDDYQKVTESMKLIHIENLKNRRFGELSGGQKQRVLLARAICRNPKVMILDEPFSGLDANTSNSLCDILKTFNSKLNVTIIMVTHNQRDVENYASHVIYMNKIIQFYGPLNQWLNKRKSGDQF